MGYFVKILDSNGRQYDQGQQYQPIFCLPPSLLTNTKKSMSRLSSFINHQSVSVFCFNRNYSAILASLQITSYALGVYIALFFTCQLHESLIKLYFKFFSIFQLFSWIEVKVLISFA